MLAELTRCFQSVLRAFDVLSKCSQQFSELSKWFEQCSQSFQTAFTVLSELSKCSPSAPRAFNVLSKCSQRSESAVRACKVLSKCSQNFKSAFGALKVLSKCSQSSRRALQVLPNSSQSHQNVLNLLPEPSKTGSSNYRLHYRLFSFLGDAFGFVVATSNFHFLLYFSSLLLFLPSHYRLFRTVSSNRLFRILETLLRDYCFLFSRHGLKHAKISNVALLELTKCSPSVLNS